MSNIFGKIFFPALLRAAVTASRPVAPGWRPCGCLSSPAGPGPGTGRTAMAPKGPACSTISRHSAAPACSPRRPRAMKKGETVTWRDHQLVAPVQTCCTIRPGAGQAFLCGALAEIKKGSRSAPQPVIFMVGMARFERAASASRTLRSSQTEPHPVASGDITPTGTDLQVFFQKNFHRALPPGSMPPLRRVRTSS